MESITKRQTDLIRFIRILVFGLSVFSFFSCAALNGSRQPEIKYGNPLHNHVKELPINQYSSLEERGLSDKALPEKTSDEYERLGDALLARGNLHIAYAQYEKSLNLNPDNIRVEYKKGLTLLAGKKNDDAINQFQMVLKKKSDYAPAYEGLGRAFFQKKDLIKGEMYLGKALELNPRSWNAYNTLGNIYDYQRKYESAIQEYTSALAIKPDAGTVYNNLGVSLSLLGDYRKAVIAFNKAIASGYVSSKVYNNLGLAYANMERYDEAFEAFKKGGSEAQAYNNLGCIYQRKGKLEEAIQFFRKAIELDPKFYVLASDNLKKAELEARRP